MISWSIYFIVVVAVGFCYFFFFFFDLMEIKEIVFAFPPNEKGKTGQLCPSMASVFKGFPQNFDVSCFPRQLWKRNRVPLFLCGTERCGSLYLGYRFKEWGMENGRKYKVAHK